MSDMPFAVTARRQCQGPIRSAHWRTV